MSILYTNWLIEYQNKDSIKKLIKDLIQILLFYPYANYQQIAESLIDYATKLRNINISDHVMIMDELHFIALIQISNSMQYEMSDSQEKDDKRFKLLYLICLYFNSRYQDKLENKRKDENTNTYCYKAYGKSFESEEEEYLRIFPTYTHEFSEFDAEKTLTNSNNNKNKGKEEQNDINHFVDDSTMCDSIEIFEFLSTNALHETNNAFFGNNNLVQENAYIRDYNLKAFLHSYKLALKLHEQHSLYFSIDQNFHFSHLLFANMIKNNTFKYNQNGATKKIYNAYIDSNEDEVLKCKRILENYERRLKNLSTYWPDNSILKELLKICNRILYFNLYDPIMKYLTGLELLIQKSQNWQTIAAKEYSLEIELKEIFNLIIEWRKIELISWKQLIELEEQDSKIKCFIRWFFHVFSICMNNEQLVNLSKENEIFNSLKEFLESSSILEFSSRLDIIKISFILCYKFGCNKKILKIFWYVYKYYNFYSSFIAETINNHKNSIEKELNDFIKICRWQDMNYWALKSSTEKANKTLLKIIKKFRMYCNQIVLDILSTQNLNKLSVKRIPKIPRKFDYFVNIAYDEMMKNNEWNQYFPKCLKFMEKLINKKAYFKLNQSIKSFIQRFDSAKEAFNTKHLESNCNNNKNDEKKKQSIRYINSLKNKFLSDMFKDLNFIGLSYRKGNIHYVELFKEAQNLIAFEPHEFHATHEWKDCESEYYLCVSKYIQYKTNNSDKKNSTIKRYFDQITGYLGHLMHILCVQKKSLQRFGLKMQKFSDLNDIAQFILKCNRGSQSNKKLINDLKEFTASSNNKIFQLILILNEINFSKFHEEANVQILNDVDILKEKFEIFKRHFGEIINCLKQNSYFKAIIYQNTIANNQNIEEIRSYYITDHLRSCLQEKKIELFSLQKAFQECQSKSENSVFIESLNNMLLTAENFFISTQESFNIDKIEPSENQYLYNIKVVKTILKDIECLYKKYFKYKFAKQKCSEKEISQKFNFEKEWFKTNFHDNFIADLDNMKIDKINKYMKNIIEKIEADMKLGNIISSKMFVDFAKFTQAYETFLKQVFKNSCNNHLHSCWFFVSLIDSFKNIEDFELSCNDLNNEEGNQANSNQNHNKFDEASGLGQGEGNKDVSDQIETEDQLEDTKLLDDSETRDTNENDFKEEENGIEMSDNFNAKLDDKSLQDDAKNECDQSIDDETGIVDEDQEILDNELWNEEDKDESNESKNNINDELLDNLKSNIFDDKEEFSVNNNQLDNSQLEPEVAEGAKEPKNNKFDETSKDNEKSMNSEQTDEEMECEDNKNTKNFDDDNLNYDNSIIDEDVNKSLSNDVEECTNSSIAELDNNDKNEDKACYSNQRENFPVKNGKGKNDSIINTEDCNSIERETDLKENPLNSFNTPESVDGLESKLISSSLDKFIKEVEEKYQMESKNELSSISHDKNSKSLGDSKNFESIKETNAIDAQNDIDESENMSNINCTFYDFQHIKDNTEEFDAEIRDLASKTQEQKISRSKNEKSLIKENEPFEKEYESLSELQQTTDRNLKNHYKDQDKLETENKNKDENKIDKDEIENYSLNDFRKNDFIKNNQSKFYTDLLKLSEIIALRNHIEVQLEKFRIFQKDSPIVTEESIILWEKYEMITQQHSKELCEQIRMVLEPTLCSKLKGDYKTGKRLNMRRVMEYVATDYRKDKIWLRRTKPSKRDYKILLAIDNSSSMSDNHCIQLAYETIATLTNALNYLQVGQLGLLSFGENISLIQPLQEHLNMNIGAEIFSRINFTDNKTKIAEVKYFSLNPMI